MKTYKKMFNYVAKNKDACLLFLKDKNIEHNLERNIRTYRDTILLVQYYIENKQIFAKTHINIEAMKKTDLDIDDVLEYENYILNKLEARVC